MSDGSAIRRTGELDHVEIYVSDLRRSAKFWGWLLEEIFDYERFQSWDAGVSWRLGGTYLVFVQAEERFLELEYHRCRVGLNHLAFRMGSRAEIDRLTDALRVRGAPLLYEVRHPHAGGPDHYAVYFEDPDRIKVEVVAEPDPRRSVQP